MTTEGPMNGSEPAGSTLVGNGIGHRFGHRVLFRKLSFRLESGTATAITGPNGSGKSTLVKIMAGLLRPTAGTVALEVGEHTVAADRHPLSCGLVAPYLNVYEGFTARENLLFLARARRMDGAAERTAEVLEQVALADRADDPVGDFSSGMVQRMRIACALLARPPVLLLDEPGATLDEDGVAMVRRIVDTAVQNRQIVVLATNVASEAAICSHRIEVTVSG